MALFALSTWFRLFSLSQRTFDLHQSHGFNPRVRVQCKGKWYYKGEVTKEAELNDTRYSKSWTVEWEWSTPVEWIKGSV